MKSRSSAELQKECQNLPPLHYPYHQPDPVEKNAEKKLSSICHAFQPALAHVKCMYTSKEMMRMAISQALSALLDYLNASHAGEQGCVKAKWVNRSHGKYLMDFIESASVSLWDISYLRAVPPQMKAHVVVSSPSVELSSPLTPIPPHHHKLLTQCLTNPMPSFGIWHPHSQMSKQRGLNPLYWIKEVWK